MPQRDSHSVSDRADATIVVPDGEEDRVPGVSFDAPSQPTSPKPSAIVLTVEETAKGFGVYASGVHAPLTLANVTWHFSREAAQAAIDKFHEDFGWQWVEPKYEVHYSEQDDPNRPGEKRTAAVQGKVLEPGYWSESYGLVFDPETYARLMEEAK